MALRSLISRSPSTMASLSVLFSVRGFASKAVPSIGRSSDIFRLRPLVSALGLSARVSTVGLKCFSTRPTTSSLNDPSPNWSNRPPKETILLDGCDFEHWLVVMEPPQGEPTRDEIIDSYIKTLAQIVGSEDEARMKIYSVSTKHYFAFGALVSEELSYKIKELPRVRWVLPDSYLDVKNKDYGGEPFIDGKAVPYDPKYHEEWVRNNARANERSRRNDRPRNFDRSRNFERRRENMQGRDFQGQGPMGPPNPNPSFQGGAPFQNQGPPSPPSQGGYTPQMQSPPPPPPPSQGGYAPQMQSPPPPPPPSQGGYAPQMQSPPPPPPPPQGGPYQNQGTPYQANYPPPNSVPGGNAFQGGGNFYQGGGGGGAYQGSSGGGYPRQDNAFQSGGGGSSTGGYPRQDNSFQSGGSGGGYPRQDNSFQGGGSSGDGAYPRQENSFQARDVPGRD